MDTMTLDQREADPRDDEPLPRRPRRQFLNRRSAALAALVTCAVGFYAGVRVEKGQLSSSSTGLRLPASAGAGATRASGSGTRAAGGGVRTGGFPGFNGGAPGGSASVGTVSSVNGKTLVLTETSGNTVRVRLTSSTKISKSQSVSRKAVRPGDAIVVQGAANEQGTTVAASLTDTGASGASGSSAGGSGSGGSRAAVGSLFSSGG
jgi:hypothetical protein